MPLLLKVNEAAARLAISPSMLRKIVREGRLGHVRVGRALRITEGALDKFVAGHQVEADDEAPRRGRR